MRTNFKGPKLHGYGLRHKKHKKSADFWFENLLIHL